MHEDKERSDKRNQSSWHTIRTFSCQDSAANANRSTLLLLHLKAICIVSLIMVNRVVDMIGILPE